MAAQPYDPWNDAANAEAPSSFFYGEITMETWPCVLERGVGKMPFDEHQHSVDQRRTAIEITVTPLADQRATFTITRSTIAQAPEWYRHIWPSLKALGLTNPKEAVGKWCKLEQVTTGRKYRDRQGEEKDERTLKFLELYDTEDACRAAYLAETGQSADGAAGNGNGSDAAVEKERQTAQALLRALAKQHNGDLDAIRNAVASVPLITKHYPVDSFEFTEAVAKELS